MKARETMGIKPTIDVRHHIDHFGLADSLGFAFVVKGNEDGSGGDGSGGAGADAGGGAAFDDALLATTIVPTATEELPMSMGDSTRDFAVRAQQAGQRAALPMSMGDRTRDFAVQQAGSARSMLGGALLATTIVPTATEELPMSMGDRTRDFAMRAQQAGQRAAAAGVTRTDNEADKLGYTRPTRRRSARSMLGG